MSVKPASSLRLKTYLYLLGVGVLTLPSLACAESVNQAVSITLQQHPQVESALSVLRGAEQAEKEQFSGYFPEITVNATGGRIFGDNATSRGLSVTRGSGYSYLWEGSVAARQKIFDGFQTQNRISAARADAKASELALSDLRESLAFRASQVYIELHRVQRGLGLIKGQKATIDDYLQRIRSMVDDGAADEAELQQARDVQIILDNFIADYEGQARQLESDYAELTGHLPEKALESPVISIDRIPSSVTDGITLAKENHPLVKVSQYQSQSAKHEIEAEKSTYIPKFDGELSYLKSDKDDIIGGEVEDGRAVVRMNWGFETGGAQAARINQRNYEYKDALARTADAKRQVERNVRQAYAELATAQKQYENQKKRQDLNKKLLETYKVQFEGARISVLQLMQADNQLLLTNLETSNAQSRVLLAQYAILSSMGLLREALNIELASAYPSRKPK